MNKDEGIAASHFSCIHYQESRKKWKACITFTLAVVDGQEHMDADLRRVFLLAYQPNKGERKLVPILIHRYLETTIDMLEDPRAHVNTNPKNRFLFSCSQLSMTHTCGSNATKEVIKKMKEEGINLTNGHLITATQYR